MAPALKSMSEATPKALTTRAPQASRRPWLVWLHGIGGRAQGWSALMAQAAARGWHSLAWDMPGYGDSPAPSHASFDALSDGLQQLLHAQGLGPKHPVVLIGHSMGGMVALQHVLRHPQSVCALVLVATSPAFGNTDGAFQQAFVAQRLQPLQAGKSMAELADLVLATLATTPPGDNPGLRLAKDCMASLNPEAYELALRTLVQFEQRAGLPQVHVPTLCLAGELDQTAPAVVMQRMAQKMPAATFEQLPGCGHLLCFEHPAQLAHAVLDFLEPLFPGIE